MTDYEREAMKKTRMQLGAWGWDEREIAMMERLLDSMDAE
jgi:hypothetical protein